MMKKLFTVAIALLILQTVVAQNLVGKWNSNSIMGNAYSPEEYVLQPIDAQRNEFGIIVNLKPDGTFHSYRIPGCGQDRFPPTSSGKYTIIDKNYIHFFLEKRQEINETSINQDLGNYYYYENDNGFKLLKSSGNLERDKQIVYYKDLLSAKDTEIKAYANILDWKSTKQKEEKGVVSFCLNEAGITNFEIIFDQPVVHYRQIMFLVKVANGFRYVIYDKEYNQVALFDDTQINKTNALISEIDTNKKLKVKALKETNIPQRTSSDHNTITAFQKKKKIQKVEYNQYFAQGGGWFTTIYFENEIPVYVAFEQKSVYNEEIRSSIRGYYVLDSNKNKIATKIIKSETGDLYYPSEYVKRAMDDIKNQLK